MSKASNASRRQAETRRMLDRMLDGPTIAAAVPAPVQKKLPQPIAPAPPDQAEQAMCSAFAHHQAGRVAEAETSYRQVLALAPDHHEALHLLGTSVAQLVRLDEAIELIGRAITVSPAIAAYHHNLGTAYLGSGRYDEAIASLRRALDLKPELAGARSSLTNALALRAQQQNEEALAAFRVGAAQNQAGRLGEAITAYRRAITLRPDYMEVHNNLANALQAAGQLDEAISAHRRAIALRPEKAEAHSNLGNTLRKGGRHEEAIASFRRTIELDPDHAHAHSNLGQVMLILGDYDQGWAEFDFVERKIPAPPGAARWKGEPLAGAILALGCEQGFGDVFQFVRYAPLVHARGGRIVLVCPDALVPILSAVPGVEQIVPFSAPLPSCRYYSGLMSLPAIFKTTIATIPDARCIHADAHLVQLWRTRLAGITRLRVGCVWAGTAGYLDDTYRCRSYPLRHLEALARIPGVSLVSLQVGRGLDELREVGFPIVDLSDSLTESPGAFMDAAAVVANLDLVVTCDTGFAHFSGALGARTWTALPFSADWRWLLDRDDSPWYPTMRLCRQTSPGKWEDVFERMAETLRAELEQSGA